MGGGGGRGQRGFTGGINRTWQPRQLMERDLWLGSWRGHYLNKECSSMGRFAREDDEVRVGPSVSVGHVGGSLEWKYRARIQERSEAGGGIY